jgi:hypothetical protein
MVSCRVRTVKYGQMLFKLLVLNTVRRLNGD